MHEPSEQSKVLPENAYRELAEGEEYIPTVPADQFIPEITFRSVLIGVIMTALFSFAATYVGLRAGQVFEAAIPIAILAVGLAGLFKRKSTILENVIIQSIGAASGVVVAGAIFTIPALYILDLNPKFYQTFLAALIGGSLGILLLIPLRRYFCIQEHGRLPFPEATATTEVLATGEAGGGQARVLVVSMIVGGLYDFLATVCFLWEEYLSSAKLLLGLGERLADKARFVFKLDATAHLLGLGYIVGIRYAAIIASGSVLSFLVFIPAFYFLGQHLDMPVFPGTKLISDMSETDIFKIYVQKIGIGAIATAGMIGIIKMSRIIVTSFSLGFKKREADEAGAKRTDVDIKMRTVGLGIAITLIVMFLFFLFISNIFYGIVGLLLVFVLAFLFTPVAARAIAIVGVNPVSGMTLITLILTAIVLVQLNLSGPTGMIVALLMGCVVCTSLSMSGGFITDLKIGYWLGATPRNQEIWKFLGVLVASIFVTLAIQVIAMAYGFGEKVPAPQGKLMAAIIESTMSNEPIPYLLYGLGVMVAIFLQMSGVPPLAFALGMYLPIQINTPILLGGFLAWLVSRSGKTKETGEKRHGRGTLIASGFIAGGALMGVFGAFLNLSYGSFGIPARFISAGKVWDFVNGSWQIVASRHWYEAMGQWIGLPLFVGLCLYLYFDSKRAAQD